MRFLVLLSSLIQQVKESRNGMCDRKRILNVIGKQQEYVFRVLLPVVEIASSVHGQRNDNHAAGNDRACGRGQHPYRAELLFHRRERCHRDRGGRRRTYGLFMGRAVYDVYKGPSKIRCHGTLLFSYVGKKKRHSVRLFVRFLYII